MNTSMRSRSRAERKAVRLHRAGGSRSAVIPTAWLARHGIDDEAVLSDTAAGILITAPKREEPSIEDEPEFPGFLEFLAKDALRRPQRLVEPGKRFDRTRRIVRGVDAT